MHSKPTKEKHFEEAIEDWLLNHSGYTKAKAFDPALALDPQTLLAFIKESQPQAYQTLSARHGAEVDQAIIQRVCAECDQRGLLDVLRNGLKDQGQQLQLAYFRPATSLNPETARLYACNRLTLLRQVFFDTKSKSSLDLLLSLNGLPIATVELKNHFTGQSSSHAIRQYIKKRQPKASTPLLQFKKRALIHFAVDPDEVFMTTRLAGKATRFLPFNRGDQGGRGNPAEHPYQTGYKSGYLWEAIWQRDSWLEIIQRFIFLEKKELVETMIFPRYHQLRATRKLVKASSKGRGNYLIQHSAGSGKTKTISWAAHQLATLHDQDDQPCFSSVVVISDRRNLDKNLQNAVFQLEHKHGLVAKIDEKKTSSDLAKELNQGTKIIITTLQKFPHLLDKVNNLSERRFAVIIDEAHSSQGGSSAGSLRQTLGCQQLSAQVAAVEQEEPEEPPTLEELVCAEARSRGPQSNISFYAFTATPKHTTLELFGQPGADGKPVPADLYSMRQAIEERFILDVLQQYTIYRSYYRVAKAIARFLSLHPQSIADKTAIMVEHFHQHTSKKIKGQAKAMLVSRSRLHALRYKQAFDRYIATQGYAIKTLVAFSGTVLDPKQLDSSGQAAKYTETGLNGFKEKELEQRFASPEYQILIVAEKYQTGFDQPLLQTMFVDKSLSGVKAVQTLSRLNRSCKDKRDCFVLDFVNTSEEIREAFQPYFEQSEIDAPRDPNALYPLLEAIKKAPIIRAEEVEQFAQVYFKPQTNRAKQRKRDHGRFHQWINPAVARYKNEYQIKELNEERYDDAGEAFKGHLRNFIRLYAFLSQIIDWTDTDLEKMYAYGRLLLTKLPHRTDGGLLDLEDELDLQAFRNEQTFQGGLSLRVGENKMLYSIQGGGSRSAAKEKQSPLSAIIQLINERFGTDWGEEELLFLEQVAGDLVKDPQQRQQVLVNSKEQLKPVFEPEVIKAIATRLMRNQDLAQKMAVDAEIMQLFTRAILDEVYERVHAALEC